MNSMLDKKMLLLDSIGFDSVADFFNNVFVNKSMLVFSGFLAALLGTLDIFIEAHVYSPAKAIYVLFAATIFDIMLGISVAVRDKKFDAYKLNRAWARLVTQIAIVALLHHTDLVWEMVNDWMVNTLLLAFVLATIWSSFKNAYSLGWIQPATYLMLEKILSIQELFDGIVKKLFKQKVKENQKEKD